MAATATGAAPDGPAAGVADAGGTGGAPHGRRDGYAPIASYAATGDGRTVALVALDGSVDWWALPTADAPPAFHAILDPTTGGRLTMRPQVPFDARRRYVEGTNVLETTFTTASGQVRLTDCLNVSPTGLLAWTELARRVEGLDGEVPMAWEVAPGDRFGSARPYVTPRSARPLIRLADQSIGIVHADAGEPRLEAQRVHGTFRTTPGSHHLVALVSTDAEPLFFPSPELVAVRVDETVEWWHRWGRRVHYEGRWDEAVRRSALTLKLLISGSTGAILAAPTTSLPERVGGEKNYDYRFAWVRDMAFTIGAMIALGIEEEVHQSLSWLLSTVRRTAPDVHVFYTLTGEVASSADEVPVRGYRDSRPVQSGNKAECQTQLESFGALFDPVWSYVAQGNDLDDRTADMIADCAHRVCDIWTRRDAGLWELTDLQHYTASKVGCWTALERAISLAGAGQIASRHQDRWEEEREALATWIGRHCWSEAKGAYTLHAGTDDLDAATLLGARIGFDRGERMSSTVDALRRELGRGPLLYRYTQMVGKEGAFLACSFWMVEALAAVGRLQEAVALMDELVALSNDVGLYAEEMDPETGEMLGNFPQALTHLALVNAAAMVAAREARPERPPPPGHC